MGAPVKLFLCGDVMTGRGIDQILPYPGSAELHEDYVRDARDYVTLAERTNGPIARPVDPAYIWGAALAEFERAAPDARIVNLETSITTSDDWALKMVLYRMHPANAVCLTRAGIDGCALANNHVLDWGEAGLLETLDCLERAHIRVAGAGRDAAEASAFAAIPIAGDRRVLLLSFGAESSGIAPEWAADAGRPGVWFLPELGPDAVGEIAERVRSVKRPGDVVVASVHWGPNFGYAIPDEHRRFAHALIDRAAVDVVHGHSSHHPLGIEVHEGGLILYGAGDFLNDYEGIGSHPEFRGELSLMYFARIDPDSGLLDLHMTPLRIRRFSLEPASPAEAHWLATTLDRESTPLGARIDLEANGQLSLRGRT